METPRSLSLVTVTAVQAAGTHCQSEHPESRIRTKNSDGGPGLGVVADDPLKQ